MGSHRIDTTPFRIDGTRPVHLSDFDPAETQGLEDKGAKKALGKNQERLYGLQERLYAEHKQSLLLVLQAMDTAGKDSTIRSVMSGINPQGCRIYSFKAPNSQELDRDFLWRVHERVPPKGHIGLFNRSHYEDVLIVRVHGWASPEVLEQRYTQINAFEQLLTDTGTRIIKVMLNISKDYQLERLRRRLKRPDKLWKFNPGDLKERERWADYMEAYEKALQRCATPSAPWYVVPAEQRWFRNLLISQLLVDTLEDMNPQFPPAEFDPKDYPPESLR